MHVGESIFSLCVCASAFVHARVCRAKHSCVFVCMRCFWIDRTQPTVKTASLHTADQSGLQLGHSLSVFHCPLKAGPGR